MSQKHEKNRANKYKPANNCIRMYNVQNNSVIIADNKQIRVQEWMALP